MTLGPDLWFAEQLLDGLNMNQQIIDGYDLRLGDRGYEAHVHLCDGRTLCGLSVIGRFEAAQSVAHQFWLETQGE